VSIILKFINGLLIDSSDYQIAVRGIDTTLQANQTTNFTASWGNIYAVDASASSISVILPASSTIQTGNTVVIRRIDTSANNVTIISNGTEIFDTTHTNAIALQLKIGGSATIRCTGTKPAIVGWSNPKSINKLWTPSLLTRAIDIDFSTPELGALSTLANTGTLGGNVVQATGSKQPTIDVADATGVKGCLFDGVDDELRSSIALPLGTAYTLFGVFRQNASGVQTPIFTDEYTPDSNINYAMGVSTGTGEYTATANTFGGGHFNGAWRKTTGLGYTLGSFGFAAVRYDGANMKLRLNGDTEQLTAQTSNPSVSTSVMHIGSNYYATPTAYTNMRLFRILGFTSAITDGNVENLEGWSAWNHNQVGLLSSGHTYKNVPPIITIASY